MKQDWTRRFEINVKKCEFWPCEYGEDKGKQDRRFCNFWK